MKKSIIIVIATVVGLAVAGAHDPGEHAKTTGILGFKPEYVHVLLNPLPVYGLGMGAVLLLAAWLARSRKTEVIALLFVVLFSASAWPVLYFGQHGYNHLYPQLDTESQQWLDLHMRRAETFIYIYYATAVLGIASVVCFKRFPKVARTLSIVTMLASLGSVGISGWISRAGGQASHSEFRSEEAPPTNAVPHPHQHEDSH